MTWVDLVYKYWTSVFKETLLKLLIFYWIAGYCFYCIILSMQTYNEERHSNKCLSSRANQSLTDYSLTLTQVKTKLLNYTYLVPFAHYNPRFLLGGKQQHNIPSSPFF